MKPADHGLPPSRRQTPIRYSDLTMGLLHVLFYGPGEGEAVVLVFPDGSIGIVDGCREPNEPDGRGDPVREFLATAPSPLSIRFACLTHPHDDHYGGLGALIEAYDAKVKEIWTLPLDNQKYREVLLQTAELLFPQATPDAAPKRRGIERFVTAVVDTIQHRSHRTVRFLSAGKSLLDEQCGGEKLVITCCGPADHDLAQVALRAEQYYNCLLNENTLPSELDPNSSSGALLIRWGQSGVLLTGDLLVGGSEPRSGWNSVAGLLKNGSSAIHVWNAAHHGSEKAHHNESWDHHSTRLVVVTPFKKAASNQPPRPEQIAHMAKTASVVITSEPEWLKDNNRAWPRQIITDGIPPTRISKKRLVRSGALAMTSAPAPRDIENAVAVSLDSKGSIKQLLLSGKAEFYDCQ